MVIERTPFWAILAVTKMVSVLIFGIFCPRHLGIGSKRATLGCLLRVWGIETKLGVARSSEFGRGGGACFGRVRSVPKCRNIRDVPNCRRGRRLWPTPPPGASGFDSVLLVGAQLVRFVGEGIDECVGGGLDGRRLRIVDVVLGVHGQVFLDRIVDELKVLGHASV